MEYTGETGKYGGHWGTWLGAIIINRVETTTDWTCTCTCSLLQFPHKPRYSRLLEKERSLAPGGVGEVWVRCQRSQNCWIASRGLRTVYLCLYVPLVAFRRRLEEG